MLIIRQYTSSVGTEFFIALEDELGYLYGFARLLLPQIGETIEFPWLGEGTALIRELHVYGQVVWLDNKTKDSDTNTSEKQHTGVGTLVMQTAEKIAASAGYARVSVIAGIGVREYYEKKLWYSLEGTYMVKGM